MSIKSKTCFGSEGKLRAEMIRMSLVLLSEDHHLMTLARGNRVLRMRLNRVAPTGMKETKHNLGVCFQTNGVKTWLEREKVRFPEYCKSFLML